MGLTTPPAFRFPNYQQFGISLKDLYGTAVNLEDDKHREAWAKFEAEREWDLGDSYLPMELHEMLYFDGRIYSSITSE